MQFFGLLELLFQDARFSQWFRSVSGSVVAILGSVGAISGFEIAILRGSLRVLESRGDFL